MWWSELNNNPERQSCYRQRSSRVHTWRSFAKMIRGDPSSDQSGHLFGWVQSTSVVRMIKVSAGMELLIKVKSKDLRVSYRQVVNMEAGGPTLTL